MKYSIEEEGGDDDMGGEYEKKRVRKRASESEREKERLREI